MTEKDKDSILGLLIVYVDDFLLQAPDGGIRSAFLEKLKTIWTLTKEEVLSPTHPITFLGIEMEMQKNGDIFLHQQAFITSLLEKYGMSQNKGNTCVQVDKVPAEPDVPTATVLKSLQGYSGEFNWLATRTRADISYYTSLLASACTRFSQWSIEFVKKILRFLASTRTQGILITTAGDLTDLTAWTDAGFAGQDTKSQNGLIVSWGGSIITWRSSRQTVSTLCTAEAELNGATLGWQIVEGLRLLIQDLGYILPSISVLVDNQAALTIAKCGATWRTRYFAVRGARLNEEHLAGSALLKHCPTKIMLADALTQVGPQFCSFVPSIFCRNFA